MKKTFLTLLIIFILLGSAYSQTLGKNKSFAAAGGAVAVSVLFFGFGLGIGEYINHEFIGGPIMTVIDLTNIIVGAALFTNTVLSISATIAFFSWVAQITMSALHLDSLKTSRSTYNYFNLNRRKEYYASRYKKLGNVLKGISINPGFGGKREIAFSYSKAL